MMSKMGKFNKKFKCAKKARPKKMRRGVQRIIDQYFAGKIISHAFILLLAYVFTLLTNLWMG